MRRAAWWALVLAVGCGDESPSPQRRPAVAPADVRVRPAAARLPSLRGAPGLEALGEPREGGDGKLHVQLFDVGQGDAALIVSPTGRTVLVDTGPAESAAFLASRLSEKVQQPLDLLVLSNGLPDHAGGLESVLRATSAQRLLVPAAEGAGMADVLRVAALRGVPAYTPELPANGEQLSVPLGGEATLEVLWPRAPRELPVDAKARDEANGLALRLTHGDTALLLAGDARAETEAALLRLGLPVRATVLKVGSHGLSAATSDAWLAAVGPLAAVVSFGAGNTVGAPSASVLDKLAQAGVATWRTDLDGEIQLESDGQSMDLVVERPAAGEAPGLKHRYATGRPAAVVLPTAQQRPAMPPPAVPVARPVPVPAPALAPVPVVARIPPAEPRPVKAPAPPPPTTPAAGGDDLELPSNWGKPAPQPAVAAATRTPTQPSAPAATKPAAPTAAGGYVASSRGKVFHQASCSAAQKIKDDNRLTFKTRDEAATGRTPAKDCNP